MLDKELIFTIPLRKETSKVPSYKKGKKVARAVREFLQKHMKVEEVKIGKGLNKKLLERGRKNVPYKVQVHAIKEDNLVRVELIGVPIEKKEEKKEEEKKITEEKKVEEKKSEFQEEKKEVLEHAKLEKKGRETKGDEKHIVKQKEEKQEKIIAITGKK